MFELFNTLNSIGFVEKVPNKVYDYKVKEMMKVEMLLKGIV